MSERESIVRKKEGGAIWLAALLAIAAIWSGAFGKWPSLLLGWVVVYVAFALVQHKKRAIRSREALTAAGMAAFAAIIAWPIGNFIHRRATEAIAYSVNEAGNLVVMALSIAACAVLLMSSAVFVRAALESGRSPVRILLAASRTIASDASIWSMALIAVMLQGAALAYFARFDPRALHIIGGMMAALVQIRMLNILNGKESSPSLYSVTNRARKFYIGTIWSVSALLLLFYLLLMAQGGMDRERFMGYPFGWTYGIGYGVLVAAIAWGLDFAKRLKIVVLLGLIVLLVIWGLVVFIGGTEYVTESRIFEIELY